MGLGSLSGYFDSAPGFKSLVADRKYYFEVLYKEGGEKDNVAVGWKGPGITKQPIPNSVLFLAPEDYATWASSKVVYLNTSATGADITETVTDFPLLVRLDNSNFIFSTAKPDGRDIRFAKANGIHLPYQIERWDATAQKADIWVKIDTIHGNNYTQSIKMSWGKSTATSQSSGPAVFGSTPGYAGVWHLGEEQWGKGTSGIYKDATGNGRDGKDNITAIGKDGIAGKGQRFDKTQSDYIEIPSTTGSTNAFTYSAWINPDQVYTDNDAGAGDLREKIIIGNFKWWPTSGSRMQVFGTQLVGALALPDNQWFYQSGIVEQQKWINVAVTWSAAEDTVRLFKNGICMASFRTTDAALTNSTDPMTIGSPDIQRGFDGCIDEVQQSSVARSSSWLKLAYQNLRTNQKLVQMYCGCLNPLVDQDGDGVVNIIEETMHTDPKSAVSFPLVAIPDTAMIINGSRTQTVTYDFSHFFKDYSNAKKVAMVIPAGAMTTGATAPILRILNDVETGTEISLAEYDRIGRYLDVIGVINQGYAVTLGVPLPDQNRPFIPTQYSLAHQIDPASGWRIEKATKVSRMALYATIDHFSHFALLQSRSFGSVAYFDSRAVFEQKIPDYFEINANIVVHDFPADVDPIKLVVFDRYGPYTAPLTVTRQAGNDLVLKGTWRTNGYDKTMVLALYNNNDDPGNATVLALCKMSYDYRMKNIYTVTFTADYSDLSTGAYRDETKPFEILRIPAGGTDLTLKYVNIAGASGVEGKIMKDADLDPTVAECFYYVKDHLGSTRVVVQGGQTESGPVEGTGYYAYGEMYPIIEGTQKSREKFTGKEHDEDGSTEYLAEFKINARIQNYTTLGTKYLIVTLDDATTLSADFGIPTNDLIIVSSRLYSEYKRVKMIDLYVTDAGGVLRHKNVAFPAPWPVFEAGKCLNLNINGTFDQIFNGTGTGWVTFSTDAVHQYADVKGLRLDYFGKRYYDPEIGRWTAVDPEGQFFDGYAYAGNGSNPIVFVDDDGGVLNMVGGAAISVGMGMGIAYFTGQEYTATDFAIDAATGAIGTGVIGKFAKIGDVWSAYQKASRARTFAKLSGSHRSAKMFQKASAEFKAEATKLVEINAIMKPPIMGAKMMTEAVVKWSQSQETPKPTVTTGNSGGSTPSDKTTTKQEF